MDVRGIELQVFDLVTPLAQETGLRLLDAELATESGNLYLRLYIEKDAGVGIDDCASLSEAVDKALDQLDPIPGAYILEVTSSGEKPIRFLEEYARFAGRNVLVTTYKPVEGGKRHEGILIGLEEGKVVIQEEGRRAAIPLELVSKARLAARY